MGYFVLTRIQTYHFNADSFEDARKHLKTIDLREVSDIVDTLTDEENGEEELL